MLMRRPLWNRRRGGFLLGLIGLWVLAHMAGFAPGQILRTRIQERMQERADNATVTLRPEATCAGEPNLGFTIHIFSSGLHAAVWYPTLSAEGRFDYGSGLVTGLAKDAPVAACQAYPLIVFSHGFGGCGTQSKFFTEALARAGYIVVAPDHKDSECKVDQPHPGFHFERAEEPFREPAKWSDSTYRDRRDDLEVVLNEFPRDEFFAKSIDMKRIGGAGHSLGGYTIAGLAGAWPSWRDTRVKAALLMSPLVSPYLTAKTLSNIHVPVMYQGGTLDITITPYVRKAGGAYDSTPPPKYFMELRRAAHFAWSDFVCVPYGSIQTCNQQAPTAAPIEQYGIAFFNHYLKGRPELILDRPNPQLADYRHQD